MVSPTNDGNKSVSVAVVAFSLVLEELEAMFLANDGSCRNVLHRMHSPNIPRQRRSMRSIFEEYGPVYSRRAYRMDQEAFWKLHTILGPLLKKDERLTPGGGNPNGEIPTDLRLSMALRYFAGGDAYDIMISHGVSHSAVYASIWSVMDAVNKSPFLKVEFPRQHSTQYAIARQFRQKSEAALDNCVGAIDGMLVWVTKPKVHDCEGMSIGAGRFYCGRKKKYGVTLQAVCDANRRFLDIYIGHPASASDLLVFSQCPLRHLVEDQHLLASGLALYGDAAYMNNNYMIAPFRNATANSIEDDFNYYQSQVRINIECAFGILTQRWGVLRKPIQSSIGMRKVTALTSCLCRLHNFCIDENQRLEPLMSRDAAIIATGAHVSTTAEEDEMNRAPQDLMGGGEHFDDLGRYTRRTMEQTDDETPRHAAMHQIMELDLHRPVAKKQKTN